MSDLEPSAPRSTRVRKFDRPAPPHDWRWWIGGIGKTLIATGLLLFGFVAYQLWGTGIETARAQNSLENEFEELLAATPPSTAAPVDSAPPEAAPPESGPVESAPVESAPEDSSPDESVPPETTPVTAAPAPVASLPPIVEGDPIARLEMPSIGVDKIVVAGVATSDLKKGPGHYPETPLPGQLGNAAIAGHRTTFGQPFFDVDKLANGDEIVVTTTAGRFVYRVTGQQIVSPSDYQVIATTDPTRAILTLTSCHPKYTTNERIIVSAELDAAATTGAVAEPTINYGQPPDDVATSEPDPTNTVVDPTTSAPIDTETAGSLPIDDPTPTGNVADDQQIGEVTADAFSAGWFSDPDANGQVALWGLLLAAIGVASYLLSRTAKRDWVGLLVGIGPFVVTLYFFFQNVNRLLPPNL